MFNQHVTHRFLRELEGLERGALHITTPDGRQHSFAGAKPGAIGQIEIHDWRTIPALVFRGDVGFAEAYRDGWFETDDLPNLMLAALQNGEAFDPVLENGHWLRWGERLYHLWNENTLRGSRRNIQAHYDLGNEFYQLWLDPTMTYSSALFQNDDDALEHAQANKYQRILNCLDAPSGDILEIGCGWGGFADHALSRGDYRIKGITLSDEQHAYARSRLGQRADIVLEDYRHQTGRYDALVSIEMFEAVGEKYWPTYFAKLRSLLKTKGRAVVQTITMSDRHFEAYRSGTDMIRRYIFPGGMLPSKSRFHDHAAQQGLRVNSWHAFGQDYAKTLSHWLDRFDAKTEEVKALGFDDAFVRLWRYYLSACIAGFRSGRTDVVQYELQPVS